MTGREMGKRACSSYSSVNSGFSTEAAETDLSPPPCLLIPPTKGSGGGPSDLSRHFFGKGLRPNQASGLYLFEGFKRGGRFKKQSARPNLEGETPFIVVIAQVRSCHKHSGCFQTSEGKFAQRVRSVRFEVSLFVSFNFHCSAHLPSGNVVSYVRAIFRRFE
jgi:hypothetical protein